MDRHEIVNTKVLVWQVQFPLETNIFGEINLPCTTKQYKNDNIANFVYHEKPRNVEFM